MIDYILKTYHKEFLEAQQRVGKEVTKDWISFTQSSVEQLRRAYSQSDFDPETKHYCFLEEELIGFMTSKINFATREGKKVARIQFPLVLLGHEPAFNLLYDTAIETLKRKGVAIVEARASKAWGKTAEYADKLGFTFQKLLIAELKLNLSVVDLGEPELAFDELDITRDAPQVIEHLVDFWKIDEEGAKAYLSYLAHIGERTIALPAFYEGDKLAAHGAIYHTRGKSKEIFVFISLPGSDKQFKALIARAVQLAKENGADYLITHLDDLDIRLLNRFQAAGFTLEAEINLYEKKI